MFFVSFPNGQQVLTMPRPRSRQLCPEFPSRCISRGHQILLLLHWLCGHGKDSAEAKKGNSEVVVRRGGLTRSRRLEGSCVFPGWAFSGCEHAAKSGVFPSRSFDGWTFGGCNLASWERSFHAGRSVIETSSAGSGSFPFLSSLSSHVLACSFHFPLSI